MHLCVGSGWRILHGSLVCRVRQGEMRVYSSSHTTYTFNSQLPLQLLLRLDLCLSESLYTTVMCIVYSGSLPLSL